MIFRKLYTRTFFVSYSEALIELERNFKHFCETIFEIIQFSCRGFANDQPKGALAMSSVAHQLRAKARCKEVFLGVVLATLSSLHSKGSTRYFAAAQFQREHHCPRIDLSAHEAKHHFVNLRALAPAACCNRNPTAARLT